jgi:hypothetical protein
VIGSRLWCISPRQAQAGNLITAEHDIEKIVVA